VFELLLLWPRQKGIIVRKHCACATKNVFKVKGDIAWLEGILGEEMWQELATILGVKTAPKRSVVFFF